MKLYHATYAINIESIQKNGLIAGYDVPDVWREYTDPRYVYFEDSPIIARNWIAHRWATQILEEGDFDFVDDVAVFEVDIPRHQLENVGGTEYLFFGNIRPEELKLFRVYDFEEVYKKVKQYLKHHSDKYEYESAMG